MLYTLFRCVLFASGLLGVTSFMAFTAAFAGTTATVDIKSIVNSTLAISVIGTPNQNIDLSPGRDNSKVKVADLQFGTNNSTGLNVTATTIIANPQFSLTNANTDTSVGFRVAINDETANPGVIPAAGYSQSSSLVPLFSTSVAASINSPYSLYIRYSTLLFLDPGIYTATINLTVTDK
jgi:hypothetical protein